MIPAAEKTARCKYNNNAGKYIYIYNVFKKCIRRAIRAAQDEKTKKKKKKWDRFRIKLVHLTPYNINTNKYSNMYSGSMHMNNNILCGRHTYRHSSGDVCVVVLVPSRGRSQGAGETLSRASSESGDIIVFFIFFF